MSWDAPSWKKAALDYHAKRKASGRVFEVETEPARLDRVRRMLNSSVSLERAYYEFSKPIFTPEVTIEAILHCVKIRGIKALGEPANQERLSRCGAAARAQIKARIAKMESIK
jgi:hypothetical protein